MMSNQTINGPLQERWYFSPPGSIFLPCFLLVLGGLIAHFTASAYFAGIVFGSPYHFFYRQIIWVLGGGLFALFVSILPKNFFRKTAFPFLVLSIGLNILTIFFGYVAGGARRWLEIGGVSFQPSSMLKISLILYTADIIERKHDRLNRFFSAVLPFFIWLSLSSALVGLQNDFSSGVIVFFLPFLMVFAAGMKWRNLLPFILIAVVGSLFFLFRESFRLHRLGNWFQGFLNPEQAGYQIRRSLEALREGGLTGKGLGRGVFKLGMLPAAHSDFVLSVLGEEIGFIGILFVLGLYLFLGIKGYRLALNAGNFFDRYVAFGLTTSIVLLAFVNMGVVNGCLPATGVPLPLFSTGGTSSFITMTMMGLLGNIASRQKRDHDE